MKTFLLLIFVFFIQSTTLFCQLEKGDWLLSSENQYSVNQSALRLASFDNGNTLKLSESIGYMVNNRIMVGMGLAYNGELYPDIPGSADLINKTYTKSISPFIRYYVNKGKKILPFAEFKAVKTVSGIDGGVDGGYKEHEIKTTIGLGLYYSIAPNIVLESIIGTKVTDSNGLNVGTLSTDQFYTNIGFKTTLNKKFDNPIDLKKDYLKKGNCIISGSAFLNTIEANSIGFFHTVSYASTPNDGGVSFGLSPSITYFKSDNWLVSGELDFKYVKTGVGYRYEGDLNFESSWFVRLKKQLFLKPSIGLGYSRTTSFADAFIAGPLPSSPLVLARVHQSIHSIAMPVSLALVWFIGDRYIFTNGANFQFEYLDSKDFSNSRSTSGKVFSNFECFLAPNLSFDAQVGVLFDNNLDPIFNTIAFESNVGYKLDFSLGFNYFVFR